MTDDERSRESAQRLAGLLTRSAMALERSAALVEQYTQLSRRVVGLHTDALARADAAREAARRSRDLMQRLP